MEELYDLEGPPFEIVPVKQNGAKTLPGDFARRILVMTLHDGAGIPADFRASPAPDPEQLEQKYILERDWGANLVARNLATELGLKGYGKITIARVLLDFNRFPGTTPPGPRDPLERLAINSPFAETLDHPRKTQLLEEYYDKISSLVEEEMRDKQLIICVHTYDEHNPSLTRRPDMSVITRAVCYQHESRMPFGVFDPMYPDLLGESSCSRVLRDRISLNLERSGIQVSHNHPYPLPVGSLEVRSQVWYFFRYIREQYQRAHPENTGRRPFEMVWRMLSNTNLRQQSAESLKGYLHRYHRVPQSKRKLMQAAQCAYDEICRFLEDTSMVTHYRRSKKRPSSLSIEVRKDLLCPMDPQTGRPIARPPEMDERAETIGRVMAGAIHTYLETDRDASSGSQLWREAEEQS